MRFGICAVLCVVGVAACGGAGPSAPQGATYAPATTGDALKTAAQAPGCPAGATCRLVSDTGAPAPDAQFVAQCTGRFPDFVDLGPADPQGPALRALAGLSRRGARRPHWSCG